MSEYKIDREKAIQLGKELGLKVTFDSETPGVLNTKTGEFDEIHSVLEEFFKGELNYYNDKIKKMNEYFSLKNKNSELRPDFNKVLDEEIEAHHEVLERLGDD